MVALIVGLCAPARGADIVVGHVAGFTGPAAKDAADLHLGARVFFDAVNDRGGLEGKRFRIVRADDRFDAKETKRLVGGMVGRVSALLPIVGSAGMLELIERGLLDGVDLPIVGSVPSPEATRVFQRNIFHYRASDADQIRVLARQLVSLGYREIGVIAAHKPFGVQSTLLAEQSVTAQGARLTCKTVFKLGEPASLAESIAEVKQHTAQALIVLAPPEATAEVAQALHRERVSMRLYALSYADHRLLHQGLGTAAAGVGIVQVMPSLGKFELPLIQAFSNDFRRHADKGSTPNYLNLEGYISARLIFEAIRRSKDTSAEGVRKGLEQLSPLDLGGMIIQFSADKHTGSTSWTCR